MQPLPFQKRTSCLWLTHKCIAGFKKHACFFLQLDSSKWLSLKYFHNPELWYMAMRCVGGHGDKWDEMRDFHKERWDDKKGSRPGQFKDKTFQAEQQPFPGKTIPDEGTHVPHGALFRLVWVLSDGSLASAADCVSGWEVSRTLAEAQNRIGGRARLSNSEARGRKLKQKKEHRLVSLRQIKKKPGPFLSSFDKMFEQIWTRQEK